VLWVVWIWDGLETRHAAENAAISKATLTGVVKTLEARGLMTRRVSATDRRLVNLELTPAGLTLMKELYPAFNAAETEVVAGLSPKSLAQLTNSLRSIIAELETRPTAAVTDDAEAS
jgi:DNA-binding MarR family transcriptional regulator